MELTGTEWLLAVLGAVSVGLGKGGLPGAGNLAIPFFAMAFGAKASVGLLLPVLTCADIVAIIVYRRHAEWRHIRRLFPVTALGVVAGFFLFDLIPGETFGAVMGWLLLVMTALHFVRQQMLARSKRTGHDPVPHTWWFIGGTGFMGGLATMLANAAGPVAAFYLMAVKLPKFVFVGTMAWYFFIVNLFKMPLQAGLGLITLTSLQTSLLLGLVAAAACTVAPKVVSKIPQGLFEKLVWVMVVVAALNLIFS